MKSPVKTPLKTRAKTGAAKTTSQPLAVPQDRREAETFMLEIGQHQRHLTRLETGMDDAIAKIKAAHAALAVPITTDIALLTDGLRIWAEANRAALTDNHKVKSAQLATGKILWRSRPASVRLSGKIDIILARLKAMGLNQFVRTSETINKEAMLAEKTVAASVPGVSIGSEGEDFEAVPDEAEIGAAP